MVDSDPNLVSECVALCLQPNSDDSSTSNSTYSFLNVSCVHLWVKLLRNNVNCCLHSLHRSGCINLCSMSSSGNVRTFVLTPPFTLSSSRGPGVRIVRICVIIGPLSPHNNILSPALMDPWIRSTSIVAPSRSTTFTSKTWHSNSFFFCSLFFNVFCDNNTSKSRRSCIPSPVTGGTLLQVRPPAYQQMWEQCWHICGNPCFYSKELHSIPCRSVKFNCILTCMAISAITIDILFSNSWSATVLWFASVSLNGKSAY